jgi:alpha/beta superfamily hydrolase
MQLLMRRHQIEEFVSVAAPANRFDFSFLAPCPRSDLFIRSDLDRVAPLQVVIEQIDELKAYKEPASSMPSCPGPTTSSRTGSSR